MKDIRTRLTKLSNEVFEASRAADRIEDAEAFAKKIGKTLVLDDIKADLQTLIISAKAASQAILGDEN